MDGDEDGKVVASLVVPTSPTTGTTPPNNVVNGINTSQSTNSPPPDSQGDGIDRETGRTSKLNRRRGGRKVSRDHTNQLMPLHLQFVQSIRRKDVSGVAASLQENPDQALHRLEDPYGVSAIEHAVVSQCWEIVERLVDKTRTKVERAQAVERAMLFAIRENNATIVDKLITLHKDMKMCRRVGSTSPRSTVETPGFEIHETSSNNEDQYWEDAEYSPDINPMVLAAQLERVEIIQMLYEKCCPMIHALTADRETHCLFPKSCYICHENTKHVGRQNIQECRAAVQVFRALSTPAYLFHPGVDDPILEAFVISDFLEKRTRIDPAYREEYERISTRCRHFATALLGLCRSSEEVETLLRDNKGIDRTHRTQFHDVRFPRLLLAINYNQKEFVSHPNTQQVMQNVWYHGLPNWVCVTSLHHVRLITYCLLMFILMPITMSLYIFRVPKLDVFVKPPVNKFILDLCSFVYFLIMIFVKVSSNIRPGRGDPIGVLDVFIFIWVIGLTIKYFVVSFRRKDRSWTYNNAENSDWRFHELLSLIFFWVYYIIMIILWAITLVRDGRIMDRREMSTWDSYLLAEASFALASILTVIQIYSFFKMSSILGPLQVSLKKMVFDVAKFLILFFVVLSAFAVGLAYIYEGYSGYRSFNVHRNETEEQEDYFDGLERAYKTLFWNIFGYGEVEYANIVLEGYRKNGTLMPLHTHRVNELLGYAIYGVYHITVVVVLLNMLIAMMANSYNNIEANSDMEWKYARTRLIMNYVDEAGVLCAPFNVLPIRRVLAYLGKRFRRCAAFKKAEDIPRTRSSKSLIERLQKRYWKARKQKQKYTSAGSYVGEVAETLFKQDDFVGPLLSPINEDDVQLDVCHNIAGITLSASGT